MLFVLHQPAYTALMAARLTRIKLYLYTGLIWVLAALQWLLKFGRWAVTLFVIVMSIVRHEGFVDVAIIGLLLVVSWWGLGQMVSGIDELGGWLSVEIMKIREPAALREVFEALADLEGEALGAKMRAFNRGELPKAEMQEMKERFRKAGF